MTPCFLQVGPRGVCYNINEMGSSTLPCGSPKVKVTALDVTPRSVPRSPITTFCDLFLK